MSEHKTWQEEFKVTGEEVLSKIKELIKEGNITRILLKNEKDEIIMEVPLTFAVVGVVLAPIFAAIGAAAALLTKCTIVVERRGEKPVE
ncbi:MAG TPA: DUF4342 domain-containing protein [Chitinophagaceae bacterium]|jgi:hypothetical protein|nr:DUF4342 domain-containing protein [Chitinophagaceae bacterium]